MRGRTTSLNGVTLSTEKGFAASAARASSLRGRLETTSVAPAPEASLYMYGDADTTVWFDDFRALPLKEAHDQ